MAYSYDRTATHRAASESYVVRHQYSNSKPFGPKYQDRERAVFHAEELVRDPRTRYVAIESYAGGTLVDTKILKGTMTSDQKKLIKLRKDLAKLKQYQERAVGGLNKAEFNEDIEWTEAQIAKLERS